jgi:proteasome lid subunit RPN8/RPN11
MRLSREHVETIIRHCRAGLPNEACGVLAGAGETVDTVYCLENAKHSPVEYTLADRDLLLLANLEDEGRLLAAFHSHPHSEAYPSATDRRQAAWDVRYVIVSLRANTQPVMRCFHIVKDYSGSMNDLGTVVEEDLDIYQEAAVDGTIDA